MMLSKASGIMHYYLPPNTAERGQF